MAGEKLFGFGFRKSKGEYEKEEARSFVEPDTDGSIEVATMGAYSSHTSYTLDLDGIAQSENALIDRYREIIMIPEVDRAVEEIVSDAIVGDELSPPITLNLDRLEEPAAVKKKIVEAMDKVLSLLYFNSRGYDIFKRWYVDGRIYYHIVIDEKNPRKGIIDLRYIHPKKIKKIREIQKDKNEGNTASFVKKYREYYVYSESGLDTRNRGSYKNETTRGLEISKESIAHCNSGILDPNGKMILSYLHKAIRVANNLRMMEDSMVIYRIARAPERRIFYVDVGNLPKGRSEQYMQQIMSKHKNKIVYDASTGEVKDDRKHMAMTEDYWIPRREGSRGTEIDTLPGGDNLGVTQDIEYFKSKLLESLNVPMSRLSTEPSMFSRGTEITRDELRFARFISRLRMRFSGLFEELLGRQLVLTGIMSHEYWEAIKHDIIFDFSSDNYFSEAKEAEILQQRVSLMNEVQPYVGELFSKEFIMKKILMMTDEDIKEMKDQIKKEAQSDEDEGDPTPGNLDKREPEKPEPEETQEKVSTLTMNESESELEKSMSNFFKSMTESNYKGIGSADIGSFDGIDKE